MANVEVSRLEKTRKKYQEFSKKFKLDAHHTIERFSIASGAFVVTGLLIVSGGLANAYSNSQTDLTTIAAYTNDFTTSRTNVTGNLAGVYGDKDKTKVLAMVKFERPADMSSNAADYEAYVTGIDGGPTGGPTKVKQATVGSVMTFASTGYMGILLEAPEGFNEQLLSVTVRSNKEIASNRINSRQQEEKANLDQTFVDHDQWRMIINPTASEVVYTPALDAQGAPDIKNLYTQAVTWGAESKMREDLNKSLADMRTQLERITNYEQAMQVTSVRIGNDENVRMVPPVLPDDITGDSVEGLSATELAEAMRTKPVEDIPEIASKSEDALDMDSFATDLNAYRLNSAVNMPGGFNFDWRSRTLNDGYLSSVVPAGQDPATYIANMSADAKNGTAATRNLVWPLTNGMLLSDINAGDAAIKPLTDLRNNASQAYSDYAKLKHQYQVTQLGSLLLMEVDINGVARNTQIVTGTDAVEFKM